MLSSLKRFWRNLGGQGRQTATPQAGRAEFRLLYGPVTVGVLSMDNGNWKFRYTDEFRNHPNLRPIVQFPDLGRTYVSDELWPFFGMRIPSLKQPSIREVVKREAINERDKVQLLRRFGRKTISNPFELVGG